MVRTPTLLLLSGAVAVAAPVLAARLVQRRVDERLVPALTELTGQPVRVGGVDVGLTGTVRLDEVAIGTQLTAAYVEARVALSSLLAGRWGADEIEVAAPRLRARLGRDGQLDLATLIERVASRRAGPSGPPAPSSRRLRRIVVSGGDLVVSLPDGGQLRARGVEVHPSPGGARVVTRAVEVRAPTRLGLARARWPRVAADLRLPHIGIDRLLAADGELVLGSADARLRASRLTVMVDRAGQVVGRADVDDGGVPRPVTVVAVPRQRSLHVRADDVPLALAAPLLADLVDLRAARATGALALVATRTGSAVEGDLAISALALTAPGVAGTAMPTTRWTGRVELDRDRLRLAGTAATGALAVELDGWIARQPRRGVSDLTVTVRPVACLDALDSVPAAARDHLDGLTVQGELRARAQVRIDPAAPAGEAVQLDLDGPTGCLVLADAPAAAPAALTRAHQHVFPDGHHLDLADGSGLALLRGLPAHVVGAFVAGEDARFRTHRGFDLNQIARSLEINLREGRLLRGGSTISQQLVKNEWLGRQRTFARKLQEVILTWRLEQALGKDDILGHYLEIIELGPGVWGLAAAAAYWFGKAARDLTAGEAAFLAALTPEPATMSRRLAMAGGLDPRSAERRAIILRGMKRAGVLSEAQLTRAVREPVSLRAEALALAVSEPASPSP